MKICSGRRMEAGNICRENAVEEGHGFFGNISLLLEKNLIKLILLRELIPALLANVLLFYCKAYSVWNA